MSTASAMTATTQEELRAAQSELEDRMRDFDDGGHSVCVGVIVAAVIVVYMCIVGGFACMDRQGGVCL